jgi:hypothetical protein
MSSNAPTKGTNRCRRKSPGVASEKAVDSRDQQQAQGVLLSTLAATTPSIRRSTVGEQHLAATAASQISGLLSLSDDDHSEGDDGCASAPNSGDLQGSRRQLNRLEKLMALVVAKVCSYHMWYPGARCLDRIT